MQRFLTAILLLSGLLSTLAAQSDQVLVHEVGSFPCDGFRGTIDILLTDLKYDHPDQDGIVVNVGRGYAEIDAIIREEMIRSQVRFRGFDASRIRYMRSVEGEFNTRYLRTPKGSVPQAGLGRNYAVSTVDEPVVVEDYEFDDLCPPIDLGELFSKILNDNPESRATILVRGKTEREAWRKRDEVYRRLVSKGKISTDRLTFLVAVKRDFNYGNDAYVEYRFIPKLIRHAPVP